MIFGRMRAKLPDTALFLAVNVAAVMLIVMFVIAPVLTHFSERSEQISENAARLQHFEDIMRQARAASTTTATTGGAFFPAGEERIVSADMQASLKSLANNAGVSLLGIRGLAGSTSQHLRLISVSVEVEGALASIRDMMRAIEAQRPLLLINSASLRSVTDGEEGPIRAELTVQGAMQIASKVRAGEASSQ
ncbi:type II secretion system protein GspM [Bradyrhizobium lablabi]|uniref:type II secretion system protein GspM n=1 Tax=Bradyrhizobium lablabi TaxID=722472 RepID=UPI001BA617C7|nr:type II secretion system protein GspM [Bradyrhizobium lablabi]MBR0697767.1 hypothetical protein [Bradyrhizobium lablabi]